MAASVEVPLLPEAAPQWDAAWRVDEPLNFRVGRCFEQDGSQELAKLHLAGPLLCQKGFLRSFPAFGKTQLNKKGKLGC